MTDDAALMLRIEGYQASRDYAIDLLAKALGIEPDKMRAVEYYAREAADRIAALTAEVALERDAKTQIRFSLSEANDMLLDRAEMAEAEAKALRELYKRQLQSSTAYGSGSSDAALEDFIDAAIAGAAGQAPHYKSLADAAQDFENTYPQGMPKERK